MVLPQDPTLDHKFPRPITERSHCGGIWEALEENIKEDEDELKRDCYADGYIQPLSNFNSEVRFYDNGLCLIYNHHLDGSYFKTEKHI